MTLVYATEDGFGAAKRIEGKHFIIYYDPQVDPYLLLQKLNIGSEDALLSNEPVENGDDLAVALDAFYGRIGGILDMNLYSLQSNLKICRDSDHIGNVYRALFDRDLKAYSFYVNELNTIYISANHFTKEVLGHEIAHMIISHYFVVQPSSKVAEILAGYVEYQLRKSSRDLSL